MGSKHRLCLTLDKDVKEIVLDKARERGISGSELIREALHIYLYQGGLESRDEIELLREDVKALGAQLYPMGSNLNRLVATWNDIRVMDGESLRRTIVLLHDLQQEAVKNLKKWRYALASIL